MAEVSDSELVREFVARGPDAEEAFAGIVRRYVNLVYSVALRLVGNGADAQDVSQAVFIVLARKAHRLGNRSTLTGWLYETTRLTASRHVRTRGRQVIRDHEAFMHSPRISSHPETDDVWRQVEPALEEGMSRLGEGERVLLALRFFDNKTGAEAAAALGIGEAAAHKRTARALEKLRRYFATRGISSTTTAIAVAISAHSLQAAPATLAKLASAAALGKTAAGGLSVTLAKGTLNLMAWSTAKTVGAGAALAAMAVLLVTEHRAGDALRAQNDSLAAKLAKLQVEKDQLATQRRQPLYIAAPPPTVATDANSAANHGSNLWERLKDQNPKLTPEQVARYLGKNGRTASSLLAAFRTSGDRALLKEAMEKFPNDPKVAFEAAISTEITGAEKRQWLNTLEKTQPDNALGNYLSALDYFNSGQSDQAMKELTAASGKPLNELSVERTQDDVEAFLQAGYPLSDATVMGSMSLILPQLAQVKQMALAAVDMAKASAQSGDTASAQSSLQVVANIGQQFANTQNPAAIGSLVGLAIEKIALSAMDPNASFGSGTVQDQLTQVAQQKAQFAQLNEAIQPILPTLSNDELALYEARRQAFGEFPAMQWLVNRYGSQQAMQ